MCDFCGKNESECECNKIVVRLSKQFRDSFTEDGLENAFLEEFDIKHLDDTFEVILSEDIFYGEVLRHVTKSGIVRNLLIQMVDIIDLEG